MKGLCILSGLVVLLSLLASLGCGFQVGVNLPWMQYGRDFGTNSWGYAGIGSNPGALKSIFATASSNSAKIVRIWLFSDARAGIKIDSNGYPTGIDGHVFTDIDTTIQKARANGVKIVFVLFDFILANWYKIVNDVQLGGRTTWITDSSKRQALMDNVVVPVLKRYASEDTIAAWEIMNEPEWIIRDLPQATVHTSDVDAVNLDQFYAFASAISTAVHTYTTRNCTLGSATLKWHVIWTDAFATSKGFTPLRLDFYQTHYYSWMDNNPINDPVLGTFSQSPVQQHVSGLNLDKPIYVGELAASSDLASVLGTLLSNGYNGAWAWSVNADYAIDSNTWNTINSWASNNAQSEAPPKDSSQQQQQQQQQDNEGGDGLSGGSIAGIAVGGVVVATVLLLTVVALVLVVVVVVRRRRKVQELQSLSYVKMNDEL